MFSRPVGHRSVVLGRHRPATLTVAVLAVVIAVMTVLVRQRADWLQTVDRHAADGLHSLGLRHRWFVSTMRVISDVGAPGVWWVAVVPVAALLAWRGARRSAMFAVVTLAGSWLVNRLVKLAVGRARPHLSHPFATASGASFPSGHAQAVTVACGVLLVVGWPSLSATRRALSVVVAALAVCTVSLSRVALGVHFVSDVVGGVLLGIVWLLVMTTAFSQWPHREPRLVDSGAA